MWKGRKTDEREGEEVAKEFLEELEEKRRWSDKTQVLKDRLMEVKERVVALRDSQRREDMLRGWKQRGLVSLCLNSVK